MNDIEKRLQALEEFQSLFSWNLLLMLIKDEEATP